MAAAVIDVVNGISSTDTLLVHADNASASSSESATLFHRTMRLALSDEKLQPFVNR